MAYSVSFSEEMEDRLSKLYRRDRTFYNRIAKKIDELRDNPKMGKPMKSVLKGSWRVHVGHFVLMYMIDDRQNLILFYKIEHHDKAY